MRTLILTCAAIFFAGSLFAAEQPAPLLVFLPGRAAQPAPSVPGWQVAVVEHAAPSDSAVLALEDTVLNAEKGHAIDPLRVYLAGEDEGVAAVFYAVSRRPDLWAAALALGGNPRLAVASNHLFAANTSLVPLLWIRNPQDRGAADFEISLRKGSFNLAPLPSSPTTHEQAYAWLGGQKRSDFPPKVDCETGNPQFGRCYWVEIAKLDPAQRNTALDQTRISPGSGAHLDLGGFGFMPDAPGPGVLVGLLPRNYNGPLKIDDRIVAVGGHTIADGRDYADYMAGMTEEKSVAIMIQRGEERIRLETRILMTKRDEVQTARVEAEYSPASSELVVVSRGASELKLRLPEQWAPCRLNWNGTMMGTADSAGCWSLASGTPLRHCQ